MEGLQGGWGGGDWRLSPGGRILSIGRTGKPWIRALELRRRYGWGPGKIAAYMKREGIRISHCTVYRYLCNAGLNNPLDKPRKTWGKKRFQREHPILAVAGGLQARR